MSIKRNPTSYHVAKLAGVSRTTVSFVLNNRTDVAIPQKTRDAVMMAAKQLGYRPNRAASALASSTTNTMAFWLTSLSSVLYLNWIQHMQSQSAAKGFDLVFSEKECYNKPKMEPLTLAEWPVDGIFAYGLQWLPAYLQANPLHTPTVLMGYYYTPGADRIDHVGLDLYTPTVECMKHLILTGRKRIAYFHARVGAVEAKTPRFQAYQDMMQEAGLPTESLASPGVSRPSAYDSLKSYVEQNGFPDALVCCNDDFAVASLRAARDLGLRVPDDLAVAGSDGQEETSYHEPRLTTIELPYTEMCETAWQFMERRIEDPKMEPQETIVPARLMMRESTMATTCVAVSDDTH